MTKIVTVTLNPALDITTEVDQLLSGKKLRCQTPRYDPGGGGINVSRAIKKLGSESLAFAANGGVIGEVLRALLSDEAIDARWFNIEGATRESFVVQEQTTGLQYRFVLPGPRWRDEIWQQALEKLLAIIVPGDCVVASGSLPPGVPKTYYSELATRVDKAGATALIDTSGGPLESLARATSQPSAVIVMDEDEACQLIGCASLDISEAHRLARELLANGTAQTVVITLGARGALALSQEEGWRVTPPLVEVDSKVGAGDSFVAGLVIGLSARWPLRESAVYAMAAASSAVMTPATELCTRETTESLRGSVTCTTLE